MTEDYVCRSMNIISDKTSLKCFLERALFHIKNKNSLIIIDERVKCKLDENDKPIYKVDEETAGILISRVIDKFDYGHVVSRTSLMDGQAQKDFVEFKHDVGRNYDVYDIFNCNSIMFVYYVCIKPKFRHRGIQN